MQWGRSDNLNCTLPEVLHHNPTLQARTMSNFHAVLLMALSASPKFNKLAFSQAERLWGRSVVDFGSPEAFLREFEITFRDHLKEM